MKTNKTKRFFFLLFVFLGFANARSLEDIRESGYIIFGTREKETIFNISNNVTNGFHYKLSQKFAKSLKLKPKYVLLTFPEYFNLNKEGKPLGFKKVDVYVDALTYTPQRAKLVNFVRR